MKIYRFQVSLIFVIGFALSLILGSYALYPKEDAEKVKEGALSIIDYQKNLNKNFKKVIRPTTKYIIIHTSEAGLSSTLSTLSGGKNVGRYRTVGGHTNYTISRDGRIYRILNHRFRADHAGLSMWDGEEDISSYSVGIELVGYHYDTITDAQYNVLSPLLKVLQRKYDIPDKNVLTHSQVSYGKPNRWYKQCHRGRKRCALNFDREKCNLTDTWHYDPDVESKRLTGDPYTYAVFYKKFEKLDRLEKKEILIASYKKTEDKPESKSKGDVFPKDEIASGGENLAQANGDEVEKISNVISKTNTAWNISGEDFDNCTTLYLLPDKRKIRGDQIDETIGWEHIPIGTEVQLNQPLELEKETQNGPVFSISKQFTAWSFAGFDYNKSSTFYFLPDGRMFSGDRLPDWDSIPDGTSIIVGYKGPFLIEAVKGKTAWGLAGKLYNQRNTVYLIPDTGIMTGDQVKDFSNLPNGSQLFLKITN